MMLEKFSAGRLELNLVLNLSHLVYIGAIRWTKLCAAPGSNINLSLGELAFRAKILIGLWNLSSET